MRCFLACSLLTIILSVLETLVLYVETRSSYCVVEFGSILLVLSYVGWQHRLGSTCVARRYSSQDARLLRQLGSSCSESAYHRNLTLFGLVLHYGEGGKLMLTSVFENKK